MKAAIICFPSMGWQAQFPTGAYKIKEYCKKEYQVFVVDERIEEADAIIENLITENEVLCLGLSVMTGVQIDAAIRLSQKFHNRLTIVWGGVHPTICPKSVIDKEYVDYVIRGDGEEAFLNLLRKLDKDSRKVYLDSVVHCFEDLNQSVINFGEESIPETYFVKRDGFNRAFPLETSRGCPHNCYFCHNSIMGNSYRVVDTEKVIQNIDQLYNRYCIDGVIFQEDNFFLKTNRVEEILYKLLDYKIGWKANSRLSYFRKIIYNEELMKLIIDSRCHLLQFGIESGSNRILRMINKGITVEEIVYLNKCLANYDIAVRYNFIIGFPTESRDEIDQTLTLINKLQSDNPHMESPFVNIYTPYPGTPLYELAIKEGFVPPKDLEGWSKIMWNYPAETLYKSKNLRDYLIEVSQGYLKESRYII